MLRSRVFLGGQAVSMLGDGLAILAVPLLVLQLTRSPVAAVLAWLPGSVGYLAAGLISRGNHAGQAVAKNVGGPRIHVASLRA